MGNSEREREPILRSSASRSSVNISNCVTPNKDGAEIANINQKGGWNNSHGGRALPYPTPKLKKSYRDITRGFVIRCRANEGLSRRGNPITKPKVKPPGSRTSPNPRRTSAYPVVGGSPVGSVPEAVIEVGIHAVDELRNYTPGKPKGPVTGFGDRAGAWVGNKLWP